MLNQKQDALNASAAVYGSMKGKDVYAVTLKNGQMEVTISNIGCAITAVSVPCRKGERKNVVAGFENILDYAKNPWYFGCVVGRYAGRISQGRFELDGEMIQLSVNEGGSHLHGGVEGFDKKVWEVVSLINKKDEVGVELRYFSPDGEEGYPGNMCVRVIYLLTRQNRLSLHYFAETDKATPVNLTNHSYFNLSAFNSALVTDHILTINASRYTEKNEQNLPTGNILSLAGSPLDFSLPKRIGDEIAQFTHDRGFDHNYILRHAASDKKVAAAELYDPVSGRVLRIFTDQPAIQMYTANLWDGSYCGPQQKSYVQHGAVALETQAFPDSPNHTQFPSTILRPGDTFRSTTVYEFDVR
ncbi:MAG TPA: aldose epimerase family protein [Chitinophagaceae bacterium]|jgi:aldose 1-epimerase